MDILIYILIGIGVLVLTLLAAYLFMIFPAIKKPEKSKLFHDTMYAHRGYHNSKNGVPENTMAAFSKAVDKGFGIEFDINLSKDGKAVIMHDNSLKRMCGVDIKITESNYDDIKNIKIGGTEETIPLLSELLSLVDGRVPLLVEIKTVGGNYEKLCQAVFSFLDGYNGDYCVESFDPRVLMWIKKHRPTVVRGQLACHISTKSIHGKKAIFLTNLMLNFLSRPHFVAYKFEEKNNMSFRLNRLFRADVFFWTISDKESAQQSFNEKGAIIFEKFDASELK